MQYRFSVSGAVIVTSTFSFVQVDGLGTICIFPPPGTISSTSFVFLDTISLFDLASNVYFPLLFTVYPIISILVIVLLITPTPCYFYFVYIRCFYIVFG